MLVGPGRSREQPTPRQATAVDDSGPTGKSKHGILPEPRRAAASGIIPAMSMPPTSIEQLRAEIAAAAARLIAEDGADYGTAKRKAARQVLGNNRVRGEVMPDNVQIEEEVRIYNEVFFGDTQPARLTHLRRLALQLMEELASFSPFLTGAVLNGTAGPHSDIHLQLFVDSAKDVEIFLLNRNVNYEVSEGGASAAAEETLSFLWQGEGVHLAIHESPSARNLPRAAVDGRPLRIDAAALRGLLAEQP
jgi:hypothetical protein